MSRSAHPAGPRHADVLPEPHPSGAPADLNQLDAAIWPTSAERLRGEMTLADLPVTLLAERHGTPLVVIDEADVRARAQEYVTAFEVASGNKVYYAGKAFLCTGIARWLSEEGLSLDVCTGGELAVALAAEFPAARIGVHGNNKSVAELTRAVNAGVGHVIVDSFDEIRRLADIASAAGV